MSWANAASLALGAGTTLFNAGVQVRSDLGKGWKEAVDSVALTLVRPDLAGYYDGEHCGTDILGNLTPASVFGPVSAEPSLGLC